MQDNRIMFHHYSMAVRSKTTFQLDQLQMSALGSHDPAVEGPRYAASYGASVQSIVLQDPVTTLSAHLSECVDLLQGLAARFEEMGSPEAASFVRSQLDSSSNLVDRAKVAIKFSTAQKV